LVGVTDRLLRKRLPDKLRQIAADVTAQGELSVGKRARAGKAGGDMAVGLAVHTDAGLAFWAAAVFDGLAFFHDGDVLFAAAADQFDGRKDAGRPGTDNDDVRFHLFSSPLRIQKNYSIK